MNSKAKSLNEQNNQLDEQINEQNRDIFTDLICYLRGSELSEYDIEMVRQDLTEMVLSAQNRGENIHSVIGEDYKGFCDEVIANLPPKTAKQKFIDGLDIICLGLSVLFAINILISADTISILQNAIGGQPVDWNISITVGSVISMGVILILANLIVTVFLKHTFSKGIKRKKTVIFLAGAAFALAMIVIAWLGKATLFTINIFIAGVIILALYAGHKALGTV